MAKDGQYTSAGREMVRRFRLLKQCCGRPWATTGVHWQA